MSRGYSDWWNCNHNNENFYMSSCPIDIFKIQSNTVIPYVCLLLYIKMAKCLSVHLWIKRVDFIAHAITTRQSMHNQTMAVEMAIYFLFMAKVQKNSRQNQSEYQPDKRESASLPLQHCWHCGCGDSTKKIKAGFRLIYRGAAAEACNWDGDIVQKGGAPNSFNFKVCLSHWKEEKSN